MLFRSFSELLARVRALLRRQGGDPSPELRVADLVLNAARHKVWRAERPIELTPKEFALLEFLMRRADTIVSRTQIAEHVWGSDYDPFSNVADVYVGYLRRKLSASGVPPTIIQTVRGLGYMLKAPQAG